MPTLRSDLDFAMPFSNVLHLSFPDKIKATRLAGFAQMSIQPQEVLKLAGEGLSIRDMKAIAADGGVEIARLDPLCPWVPNWKPTNFGADYATAHDVSPKVFFDLCDEIGCKYMSLNATFPATRYSTAQITEFYAAICRQAAEHGVTCDLECIPMWGVVTLEQGTQILNDSGVSNGGFVFDCTHFTRGGTSADDSQRHSGSSHSLRSGLRRLCAVADRHDARKGVLRTAVAGPRRFCDRCDAGHAQRNERAHADRSRGLFDRDGDQVRRRDRQAVTRVSASIQRAYASLALELRAVTAPPALPLRSPSAQASSLASTNLGMP